MERAVFNRHFSRLDRLGWTVTVIALSFGVAIATGFIFEVLSQRGFLSARVGAEKSHQLSDADFEHSSPENPKDRRMIWLAALGFWGCRVRHGVVLVVS